ncbi:hypothetical protein E4T41_09090 [Aureobasidium subglaciale]|nr:hypothetical protein E4T41_09090 [Aureobasidium subglaciale]
MSDQNRPGRSSGPPESPSLNSSELPGVQAIRAGRWPRVKFIDEWSYRGILILKVEARQKRVDSRWKTVDVLVFGHTKPTSNPPVLVTLKRVGLNPISMHDEEMFSGRSSGSSQVPHQNTVLFCDGLRLNSTRARECLVRAILDIMQHNVDFEDDAWTDTMGYAPFWSSNDMARFLQQPFPQHQLTDGDALLWRAYPDLAELLGTPRPLQSPQPPHSSQLSILGPNATSMCVPKNRRDVMN